MKIWFLTFLTDDIIILFFKTDILVVLLFACWFISRVHLVLFFHPAFVSKKQKLNQRTQLTTFQHKSFFSLSERIRKKKLPTPCQSALFFFPLPDTSHGAAARAPPLSEQILVACQTLFCNALLHALKYSWEHIKTLYNYDFFRNTLQSVGTHAWKIQVTTDTSRSGITYHWKNN
jgi:hypothetical protein